MEIVLAPPPIADFKILESSLENDKVINTIKNTYENKIKLLKDRIGNLLNKVETLKRPVCSRKKKKVRSNDAEYKDFFRKGRIH